MACSTGGILIMQSHMLKCAKQLPTYWGSLQTKLCKALRTNVGTNELSAARCPLHNLFNLKRIFDYLLNVSP